MQRETERDEWKTHIKLSGKKTKTKAQREAKDIRWSSHKKKGKFKLEAGVNQEHQSVQISSTANLGKRGFEKSWKLQRKQKQFKSKIQGSFSKAKRRHHDVTRSKRATALRNLNKGHNNDTNRNPTCRADQSRMGYIMKNLSRTSIIKWS